MAYMPEIATTSFVVRSRNSKGDLDGRILSLMLDDPKRETFRYRHGGNGNGNGGWGQEYYCIAIIRGRAPIILLDNLFVSLAGALGWEVVLPKELAFLRTEGSSLKFMRKRRDLRWKHGTFFTTVLGDGRYMVQLYYPLTEPDLEIDLTAEDAVALLEWIALHAGWELEDLPEPVGKKVRSKEAKRSTKEATRSKACEKHPLEEPLVWLAAPTLKLSTPAPSNDGLGGW